MGRRGRYARLEQDPKLHQPGGPPIPISERVYPGYVEVGDDCLDDCHGKLPTRTAGREVRAVEPLGQALEQELAVLPRRAQVPPDSNRMGGDLPRYHSLVELEVGQDEAVVVLDRRSAHRWRRAPRSGLGASHGNRQGNRRPPLHSLDTPVRRWEWADRPADGASDPARGGRTDPGD